MKKQIVVIGLLMSFVILPQIAVTEADAKGMPQYNEAYTRSQITVMMLIPAGLTSGLALMLGLARMN